MYEFKSGKPVNGDIPPLNKALPEGKYCPYIGIQEGCRIVIDFPDRVTCKNPGCKIRRKNEATLKWKKKFEKDQEAAIDSK